MRCMGTDEVNIYLRKIGMKVGEWNQICDRSGRNYDKPHWVNFQAPRNSRELHNFAQHVAGWLPKGGWKIFQVDNSTSPSEDESFLINRLLFGSNDVASIVDRDSLLFEFDDEGCVASDEDLLLSNLIFLFLMFECHGQVASSNCNNGKHLSIQDGFVYFLSFDNKDIVDANDLLKRFEEQPLRAPQ